MKKLARIAAAAAVGASSLSWAGLVAAAEPDATTSLELGRRYARTGAWTLAYTALEAAWDGEQTPEVAAALGSVELKLGRPRSAAEHLSFALSRTSDLDPAWPDVRFDLVEARRFVVRLRVVTDHPGAAVTVDDVPVSEARREALFVDAGSHVVRATLAGFAPAQRSVTTRRGDDVEVRLALDPVDAAPRRPPSIAADVAPAEPGKNPWIIGGGALAGAATLGVGIAYGIATVTSSKHGEEHDEQAGIFSTVGAGILAATVVYALWPTRPPASNAAFHAAPVAFGKGAGFALTGSL